MHINPYILRIDLSNNPDSHRYKKVALVKVQFATTDGSVNTIEGPVPFVKDDAIISGGQNDIWPVARKVFDEMYEAAPQFGNNIFQKKKTVLALQINESFTLTIHNGKAELKGMAGDWLVQYSTNEFGIVAQDIFNNTYQLCKKCNI